MSEAWALRLDLILGGVSLVLLATAAWAAIRCFRRSWPNAKSMAARAFWLSVLVQIVAWLAIPIAVVRHTVVNELPQGEASQKARILAESISEGMNCTVALILATPVAALGWMVAAWQLRRAKRGPTSM